MRQGAFHRGCILRRLLAAGAAATLALGLAGCGGGAGITGSTSLFGSAQASQAKMVQIFVASTRKDASSGEASRGAHFAIDAISIPPGHQPGAIEQPSWGSPSRASHFVVTNERKLSTDGFQRELAAQVSGRVGVSRDVLVYIHGFNTGFDEARFRLAQIVADGNFTGVPVLFTWPSRNQLLAYGSDKESATASRDPLEKLLQDLAATPGVGRVHVLAHSMGTWLAMEALRQNAIGGHADLGGHMGEVMLAAPDIDLDVFRAQMARLGGAARVSVFAAADDRALSVSATLAGSRQRLGALDLSRKDHVGELLAMNVRVYDLTKASAGDMFRHGTFAEAPEVVKSIGLQLAEPARIEGKPSPDAQAESFVDPGVAEARKAATPLLPGAVEAAPLPPAPM